MSTQLMRVPEVAAVLGFAEKTIWAWVQTGQLASVRLAGSRRIRRETVEALISAGENETGTLPVLARNKRKGPGRPKGSGRKALVGTDASLVTATPPQEPVALPVAATAPIAWLSAAGSKALLDAIVPTK